MSTVDGTAQHVSQSWASIGSFLFGALRLNALLIVGALPLVLLCVLPAEPLKALPALLTALFLAMPAVTTAFCVFRDAPMFAVGVSRGVGDGPSWWDGAGEHELIRPALRIFRRTAMHTIRATMLPMGLAVVLTVDGLWALGHDRAAIAAPAFFLGAVVAVMASFGVCVLISEGAQASWHVLARGAAVAILRGAPLTLLSIAVLGIGLLGLIWQPILCWALASSLVLYVLWANTRWSARALLVAE